MWKKYRKQNKSKSQLKLAFIALLGLILLITLAKFISFSSGLGKPLSQNLSSLKTYSWDGVYALNLLFVETVSPNESKDKLKTGDISVVNFQPKTKKITILHLSDNIYTEVPKDYGFWRLGSIYELGQEEKNHSQGALLLKLSVAKLTGLPVDGVIFFRKSDNNDPDKSLKPEKLISGWHKNPLQVMPVLGNIDSDLTSFEMMRFIWQSIGVRADKITSLDLAQSTITESKLLPDSSRVLGVDSVRLDIFIRDKLQDSQIADETATIAVFNATDHPGLAQEAARTINNLGANVVIVTNTEQLKDRSQVIKTAEFQKTRPQSVTAKRFTQIFAPECADKQCLTDDPKVTSSRAQINVILGEDYFKLWHSR